MSRQAIEEALDALEVPAIKTDITEFAVAISNAVRILRAALEEPEPYDQTTLDLCDKCGWKTVVPDGGCLNCQRTEFVCSTGLCRYRKPLTDEQITEIFESKPRWHYPPIGATDREFARDIEAAHGIGYIEHPQGFRVHPVTGDFGIGTPGKGEKE